jgi:hypothetical protein
MSHARYIAASEGARENSARQVLVSGIWRTGACKIFFVSSVPQPLHPSSTGFPHAPFAPARTPDAQPLEGSTWLAERWLLTTGERTVTLAMFMKALVITLVMMLPVVAHAQTAAPVYRVFLTDGSSLSSYGEWARVGDRIVFSMPIVADQYDQLHLVSLAGDRVDWKRTEDYAAAVRAAHYAATRGEEDFARLSADITRIVNEIAVIKDPAERLVTAERARRELAAWPEAHYGYRAREVNEMAAMLDEIIGDLRAAAGLGRFDLTLMANTSTPPPAELLPEPDQQEIVQQLVTASTLVETPAEKVSLLQTVVGILDRAVGMLPKSWAETIRARALSTIAEEQKIDAAYARLRDTTLKTAATYASKADVRALQRLRARLHEEDAKLGHRRAEYIAGLAAAVDAQIASAQKLRLAQDQWMLRAERLRAYQRATEKAVTTLTQVRRRLEDIRALAGPEPWRLKPLIDILSRERRALSNIDPPAELASIHALFRSAAELAVNAVTLRLDAVEAADLEIAQRASAAAAGAMMLLGRAKEELEAALRPPILAAAAQ